MKKHYKADCDHRYGVKPLSPLEPDTPVLIKMYNEKTWEKPGSVVLADPENRRYHVNTPTGMIVIGKSKASTACWYASNSTSTTTTIAYITIASFADASSTSSCNINATTKSAKTR